MSAKPLTTMLAMLFLFAAQCTADASASQAAEVADLPAASGGTMHVWFDSPAHPWAVAITLIGGDGAIPFEPDGSLKGGRSTLIRTRQVWLEHGLAVLIVNRPSALATRYAFRESDTYANDVRALIDFARARSSTPVWVLGHSLGTNAVASVAARLTDGQIAGVVFIAATINRIPDSGITETVFDVPLARIDVPTLVVTHAHDACPAASPEGSARLRATLTGSPRTDLFVFDGGEPSGGPCDPTALHSLVGLDTEYVARISAWMREHTHIQ
jgi:pimeloyl-ACP methyl ester carboxylesterase